MTEAEHAPTFAVSIEDLEAYFGELDAAIGFTAQSYDGCGRTVFDDRRSWELHAARYVPAYRHAVQRRTRIERGLLALDAADRATLALAFTPRQFDWGDTRSGDVRKKQGQRSGAEAKVREALHFGSGTTCLLPLVLEGTPVREAFLAHAATRAAGVSCPSQNDLLRFLEWEVGRTDSSIVAIREAAVARLLEAVARYDEVRVATADTEAAARLRAIERLGQLRACG